MEPTTPWEDTRGRFFDRVWSTVQSATLDPMNTFGRIGAAPGTRDVGAAVRFALLTTVIGWSPLLLFAPCLLLFPIAFAEAMPAELRGVGLGMFCVAVGAAPMLLVIGSIGADVLHAVVFHALSRMLRGQGSWNGSLHAMLYTATIRVWLLPATFLGVLPFLGVVVHAIVRAAFLFWTGVACYGTARGLHKLDDSSALVVAILTPLLSAGVTACLFAASIFGFAALLMGTGAVLEMLGSYR